MLAGRLTLLPGRARVAIVVLIHGAEHSSALEDYALQRQFASAGIGVFAHDKRDTGASGGRYSQNYLTTGRLFPNDEGLYQSQALIGFAPYREHSYSNSANGSSPSATRRISRSRSTAEFL